MGKTRDLFKKIRDTKGTFHAKMASIMDRNCMDLKEAEDIKKRRERQRRKGKIYSHLNAEFQRIARRDKKAFLSDQCKEIEETIEWERLEISSRKLETPKEYFKQRWAQ